MTIRSNAQSLLLAAALLAGACASAGSPPPKSAATSAYRIGPEDVIEVVVWNNEAVSRRVPVRPDGMISLPLVDEVRAAGLTPLELRSQLAAAFAKFIPNPSVFVIVQEIHSPRVLVVGEVARPGRYVIRGPTTVLDVVAEAGGLTEFASSSPATLVRAHQGRTQRFRVNARADEAAAKPAVVVQPGDVVVIP